MSTVKTVLTPREREVASLVAEGMTNREIAARLVISERTAEYHVEQIRNKLGVRSRSQVATWITAHVVAEKVVGVPIRRLRRDAPATLFGRDEPYAALAELLNSTIDGNGGTAIVLAEAGGGKTRLLAEISRAAEAGGLRVIRGGAGPAEGYLAYQAWSEALRPLAEDAAALGSPWSEIVSTLLPGAASSSNTHEVAAELRRTRLFESVARLLSQASRSRPVVVILDDLHYADPDSIALLHYVARTSRGASIALIGASRPAAIESNRAFGDAYRALSGAERTLELRLAPLDLNAVASLLTSLNPAAADTLAREVHSWAGGNPFLTLEAVRLLRERGSLERDAAATLPERVRRAVLGRFDAVPADSRRALEVLCVTAAPTRLDDLANILGRTELETADAMSHALRVGLAREEHVSGAAGVAFAHELIREAMYQELPAITRAALHGRVAGTLIGAASSVRAHHFTRAGARALAARQWLDAGDEAATRYAYDAALESYDNALALLADDAPVRADALERIGDVQLARGAAQAAIDAFSEAIDRTVDAEARVRRVIVLAAVVGRYEGRHPDALRLAREANAAVSSRGETEQFANSLVALAWMEYHDNDAQAAESTGERALSLARKLDLPRVEAAALEIVTRSRWLRGDQSGGPPTPDVERVVARLGDDGDVPHLRWLQAMALLRRAEIAAAATAAEHGLAVARRVGSIVGELETAEALIWALMLAGRYDEAVAIGDAVLPLAARIGLPRWPRATADYLHALVLAGHDDRVESLAIDILDDAPSYQPSPHVRPALFAVSALVAIGRYARATADTLAAERPDCATCLISWLAIAGRREALCGDTVSALAIAEELGRRVATSGFRVYDGAPAHIRALAFVRQQRERDGQAAAEDALLRYASAQNVGMRDLLRRELRSAAG